MIPYQREALGRLLHDARNKRGLRLLDVATQIGTGLSYVSNVESGDSTVSPETLDKLAEVLSLDERDYRRAFEYRGRLPPHVERHFMAAPWPQKTRG